jgi:hypothetical protein
MLLVVVWDTLAVLVWVSARVWLLVPSVRVRETVVVSVTSKVLDSETDSLSIILAVSLWDSLSL